MHAAITTVAFRGIETIPVEVQVHIANGLPAMAIVGLADKAVAESRERVRAAFRQTAPNPSLCAGVCPARSLSVYMGERCGDGVCHGFRASIVLG